MFRTAKCNFSDKSRSLLLGLLAFGFLLLAGCDAGGGGGSTDARLCGKWEGRKGWATVINVEFKSNGSTTMSTKGESGPAKTMNASWGVVKSGTKAIKIFLVNSSKREERTVKFIDANHIEMKSPGGGLTRLQRVGS